VPIVIRLTGHEREEGIAILERSGFKALSDMDERKAGGGMSVFIDNSTRLLVQGITGRDDPFHAKQ